MHVHTHTLMNTHTHTSVGLHRHAQIQYLHFSPLSLALSVFPAVIDALSHSARHKLWRHGYSSEMCFPQETNNIEITAPLTTRPHFLPTTPPLLLEPAPSSTPLSVLSGAVCSFQGNSLSWQHYRWPCRCVCSASPGPLCPRPALVFLLEKPPRHGGVPCGSRTWGTGNSVPKYQHLQQQN